MQHPTLASGLSTIVARRRLLLAMAGRDIKSRYRGTAAGALWMLASPLLMLIVYTYLFGVIFHARWPGRDGLNDYVVMMYCGIILYTMATEVLTRAPVAVVSQPNFVKKVVFPLELLPLIHVTAALVNVLIGIALIAIGTVVNQGSLPVTAIAFPFVVAPLALLTAGVAWTLAALGVFVRDVGHLVGIALTLVMAASPVFYPVEAAPAAVRPLLYINPLTLPIEELREVLVKGAWPDPLWLALYWAAALTVMSLGLWIFQRSRTGFADVV